MQEYGPWKIEKWDNMRPLAKIVLAFCLQVSRQIKEFGSHT